MKKGRVIRLLCDCDGVLSDFVGGALDLYKLVTGQGLDRDTITDWDFTGNLPFATKAEKETYDKLLRAPGFAMNLKPLVNSQPAIALLQDLTELHIVTSPLSGSATWAHERETWLKLHYGISHKRIVHIETKYILRGDLFVDDKHQNVRAWQEANPDGAAFLWDHPCNRGEETKDLDRLTSWGELIEMIKARRAFT